MKKLEELVWNTRLKKMDKRCHGANIDGSQCLLVAKKDRDRCYRHPPSKDGHGANVLNSSVFEERLLIANGLYVDRCQGLTHRRTQCQSAADSGSIHCENHKQEARVDVPFTFGFERPEWPVLTLESEEHPTWDRAVMLLISMAGCMKEVRKGAW
jgi:hypothetical protein